VATVEKQPRNSNGNGVGELLDRQPPRSIEAERAVIGSLLLLPEACDEVALIVRPEDFYDGAHRSISYTCWPSTKVAGRSIQRFSASCCETPANTSQLVAPRSSSS